MLPYMRDEFVREVGWLLILAENSFQSQMLIMFFVCEKCITYLFSL